jgi:hypothetical protein
MAIDSGMAMGRARVICTQCEFPWFGEMAAHALHIVGSCPRCRGALHFREESALPPIVKPVANVPAYHVLGPTRF